MRVRIVDVHPAGGQLDLAPAVGLVVKAPEQPRKQATRRNSSEKTSEKPEETIGLIAGTGNAYGRRRTGQIAEGLAIQVPRLCLRQRPRRSAEVLRRWQQQGDRGASEGSGQSPRYFPAGEVRVSQKPVPGTSASCGPNVDSATRNGIWCPHAGHDGRHRPGAMATPRSQSCFGTWRTCLRGVSMAPSQSLCRSNSQS